MLSYRHGFHAGNHADVLKHIVLCLILRHLKQKEKPFTYIDTHAGAGAYALHNEWSEKTGEYLKGIAKVINSPKIKELVPEYFSVIKKINENKNTLNYYPGSPFIAAELSRPNDSLELIELHPTEYENLHYNMYHYKNAHVHHRDAVEGLNGILPPKIRRGLVLIDPSYEMPEDYRNTIKMVKKALTKFPEATYAIWYPVLGKAIDESYGFTRELGKIGAPATLKTELCVKEADPERGMHGSGMLIINAPYTLGEEINQVLPELLALLKENDEAKIQNTWLNPPV